MSTDLANQDHLAQFRKDALAELLDVLKSLDTTPQVEGFTRREIQDKLGWSKDRTLELLNFLDCQGRLESVMVYRRLVGSKRMTPRIGYRLKREETK